MTVIEFGKNDLHMNGVIIGLSVLFAISIGTGVVLYNHLIGLRHDIKTNQTAIEQMEVSAVEMKNTLYSIVDGTGKEALLQERGLIVDEHPSYVQVPSAGHYISMN